MVVAFLFFIILVIIIIMNNKYLPLMCGTEFLAQLLIKNIEKTKVINKNFNIIMHSYKWKIALKDLTSHHIFEHRKRGGK